MFYFATARRNLLAFNALARVIEHLNAHGIPNILLKGVALALTLYKNEALRPMGDVDLLVRWDDVPRTVELLRELGYTTPIPEVRPARDWRTMGSCSCSQANRTLSPLTCTGI